MAGSEIFPAFTSTETYLDGDEATYLKKVERDIHLQVYKRLLPKFLQTQQERANERLHEDHVRTVLEAAGPASGSPGQAVTCTFWQYHMSGGASCPPEDIALRAALVIFASSKTFASAFASSLVLLRSKSLT